MADQAPKAQLLSNGRYQVLLSDAGSGASRWGEIALTRWSGDRTLDHEGLTLYVRDLTDHSFWSAGRQPVRREPERYVTRAGPGFATIERDDGPITTRLDVCVAADLDAELRLLSLTNRSDQARTLEVTSCVEVALNHPAADAGHPAFSKLFVQTEYRPRHRILLARRRPRSPEDLPLWMAHSLGAGTDEEPEIETDRARFLGRGRSPADPAALDPRSRLSGTVGNVIDPVLAIRRVIRLEPGTTRRLTAVVAAGRDPELLLEAISTLERSPESCFAAAGSAAGSALRSLELDPRWLPRLPALIGAIGYHGQSPRAGEPPRQVGAGARALAACGLTGRFPLAVARIGSRQDARDAAELEKVVSWSRRGGLGIDFVALTDGASYDVLTATTDPAHGRSVSAPVRELGSAVADTLESTAAVTLPGARATGHHRRPESIARYAASAPITRSRSDPPPDIEMFNGFGGFVAEGREYLIQLDWRHGRLRWPPLPWSNVIANETAGVIVTEAGIGSAWTANSRENRLTPWRNDPVSDPPSAALYLRDDDAATFWSLTPGPVPGPASYQVRHGFGWTEFLHRSHELEQRTVVFVPLDDAAIVAAVTITNESSRRRSLSLAAVAELVLGADRGESGRSITTALDPTGTMLIAMNPERGEFSTRVAFASLGADRVLPIEVSGDRAELLGRRGGFADPAAIRSDRPLSGRVGAGLDPAAGLATRFHLEPGATIRLAVALGEAADAGDAVRQASDYRDPTRAAAELDRARTFWRDVTGRIEVSSPSPAIDRMVNGWLPYQNLSCRIWGRSAFYQSGGAYGFRDQLQDSLALVWQMPDLTRRQILLHGSHQFPEGDVLHWWHPPAAKGIRTRFSDDLLWLPYATAFYLGHTGDESILDELLPFVAGPALDEGEDERFFHPETGVGAAPLYQHCCLALDRSLTRGAHGLPLMGTGDWNDGMNRVGREGRGESVWLGFFLYAILESFLPWCERRDDHRRATRYRDYRARLGEALNRGGWDGEWYRRAYYDSGIPLGSRSSDECRIDAIAQAWAVISGAAPADRAAQALNAAERRLVDRDHGIIRLLTPAFDTTRNDPGYIKGYLPGVRENGGQYTHGALWMVRAMAEAGRVDQAAPLLEMLSPASHGGSAERIARYLAEPYVIAADVYGVRPHDGRGGWTWYTGSAGWMFRVAIESVFGLTMIDGSTLALRPAIPPTWPGFALRYRLPGREGGYHFQVEQPAERPELTVVEWDGPAARLVDGAVVLPVLDRAGWIPVVIRLGRDVGPRYRPR